MKDRAIATRYTKALFQLDLSQNQLEKRLDDFVYLTDLHKHPKLERLLLAPQLEDKEKKELLFSLLDGRLDPVFLKFLSVLIEKRRWSYLTEIIRQYRLMVDRHLNIWEAELVTAIPIDQKTEDVLKDKLQKALNKEIKLKKSVDPKLIGGASLLIDNEMIDWSLAGKLKKMKKELLKVENDA